MVASCEDGQVNVTPSLPLKSLVRRLLEDLISGLLVYMFK